MPIWNILRLSAHESYSMSQSGLWLTMYPAIGTRSHFCRDLAVTFFHISKHFFSYMLSIMTNILTLLLIQYDSWAMSHESWLKHFLDSSNDVLNSGSSRESKNRSISNFQNFPWKTSLAEISFLKISIDQSESSIWFFELNRIEPNKTE